MRQATNLKLTFVARQREGRLLELVGMGVDAGAVLQQDLGDGHVTGRCGLHERRVSVLVVVLDVRAGLEKEANDAFVTPRACVHERGVA